MKSRSSVHKLDHTFQQVVDVIEAALLAAVAINCEILVPQRLDDEIRTTGPSLGCSRAVGIEDAHDVDATLF